MEIEPDENETFQSADAGASLTYPQQIGTIRKGGFNVINGQPCKVDKGLL
jgi:translation initiation factor 5A